MTRNLMILLATGGSVALLGGAYIFQMLGYPPCAMCLWQRWPHAAAIVIGLIALKVPGRLLPALGAVAAGTTGAIGVYHTGVERDWWEGPASCSGGGLDGLSGADLLSTEGPRIVMCDQVSWEFLSLSMASWNAIFSFDLMFGWIIAVILSGASTTKGSSRTV
ncbi:disulfide bond formation protein B [Yoonia sp. 2307UL14-13]|uniref:disulfide bond formation protein B n=1 Tax=Yoonia sp. 2307UL14-13 TaxID=3126506 RepID=UPI0030A1AF16